MGQGPSRIFFNAHLAELTLKKGRDLFNTSEIQEGGDDRVSHLGILTRLGVIASPANGHLASS